MKSSEILEITSGFSQYNPLFYTAWQLGTPEFSDDVETAAVTFDPTNGNAIIYKFNEKFWNSLTKTERMFIFAHETLHVFLDHGHRTITNLSEWKVFNIAEDIVINHMLLEKFGFERSQLPHLSKTICFFDNVFSKKLKYEDHKNQSLEYYYNLMKKENMIENIPDGLIIFSGNISDEDKRKISRALKDYIEPQLMDDDKKNINEMLGKYAGSESGTLKMDMSGIKSPTRMTWVKLINTITNKTLIDTTVDKWAPRNRRVMHLSNDLFLPSSIEDESIDKEKPNLFVFLDTSGSCQAFARRFYRALKSIPDEKFNIYRFAFGTYAYEIKNDVLKGFGGTDFGPIEEMIQKKIKEHKIPYPDLVFIITDGFGSPVTPEKPTAWHWFLQNKYDYTGFISKESHIHYLSEYEPPKN